MKKALISTYGGPFQDQEPIEDPTTQVASNQYNRALEDLAQLTRPTNLAWIKFSTSSGVQFPESVTVSDGTSVWGDSAGHHPVIEKTAVGTYTITYPATKTDSLGESEPVIFRFSGGECGLEGNAKTIDVTTAEAANVITVYTTDKATGSLADPASDVVVQVGAA